MNMNVNWPPFLQTLHKENSLPPPLPTENGL